MDESFKHPPDEKKVRFKLNLLSTKKENKIWVLIITIFSFMLSVFLSFFSSEILSRANIFSSILVVLTIVSIGILFDVVGIAVTAADESPFHAMASRKMYGAKQSIRLIRHADKVSNFCNDVIGDICGVISGTGTATIVLMLVKDGSRLNTTMVSLVLTGLVASLTVGGKAIGKTLAIENSNLIVYKVGVLYKFLLNNKHKSQKRK